MSDVDRVDSEAAGAGEGNPLVRALVAFGRFWWEFLIGDTPELFLATLVVIALAEVLHQHGPVGIVLVVVAAVGFLAASVWRGSRSK